MSGANVHMNNPCFSELACDFVDIPSVSGATVHITNTSLTYTCDDHHVYTGGESTVNCTDEGEWPIPTMTCQGEMCTLCIFPCRL